MFHARAWGSQGRLLAPFGTSLKAAKKWLVDAQTGLFVLVANEDDEGDPYNVLVATGDGTAKARIKLTADKYSLAGDDDREFDSPRNLIAHYSGVAATLLGTQLITAVVAEPTEAELAARSANLLAIEEAAVARNDSWVKEFTQLQAAASSTEAKTAVVDFAREKSGAYCKKRRGLAQSRAVDLEHEWVRRAADLDHANSAFIVGNALAGMSTDYGGCEKDPHEAIRYLTIAADAGLADAMSVLSNMYSTGSSGGKSVVAKDLVLADEWVRRARATGGLMQENVHLLEANERAVLAGVAKLDAEDASKVEAERERVQAELSTTLGPGTALFKMRMHAVLLKAADPARRSDETGNIEYFATVRSFAGHGPPGIEPWQK